MTQLATLAVRLPPELGLDEAETLRQQLLSRGEDNAHVQLDGSEVRRIGAAGLQVLVALATQCARNGQRLQWSGASAALRDSAATAGLKAILALSE